MKKITFIQIFFVSIATWLLVVFTLNAFAQVEKATDESTNYIFQIADGEKKVAEDIAEDIPEKIDISMSIEQICNTLATQ